LSHPDGQVRYRALESLTMSGTETVQILEPLLSLEMRLKGIERWCALIGYSFVLAALLASLMAGVADHPVEWFMLVYAPICLTWLLVYSRPKGNQLTRSICDAVVGLKEIEAIGLLIDLSRFELDSKSLQDALKEMLPRLHASDSKLLSSRHQLRLVQLLEVKGDAPLLMSVLSAVEQVGDDTAVPFVEQIAAMEGEQLWQLELKERAAECLHHLANRVEIEGRASTLLRPTDQHEHALGLLRPVSGAESGPESNLLIPVLTEPDAPAQTVDV
jgi:hypothetical protein